MDRRAWWATVHGIIKSQTQLKRLSVLGTLARQFCIYKRGWCVQILVELIEKYLKVWYFGMKYCYSQKTYLHFNWILVLKSVMCCTEIKHCHIH